MSILKAKTVTLFNCGEFRQRFRACWNECSDHTEFTKHFGQGNSQTINLVGQGIPIGHQVAIEVRTEGGPTRFSDPVIYEPDGVDTFYRADGLSFNPNLEGPYADKEKAQC